MKENSNIQTIIYDFDGTLVDSVMENVRIYNEIAERNGYKKITEENGAELRSMGAREVIKELGIPFFHVPFLMMKGRREFARAIPTLKPFEGIVDVLKLLKEKRYRQFLITSNSKENIEKFVALHSFDFFEEVSGGTGLFGKAARIKKLIGKHGINPRQTFYVGDETRDIESAKKAGVKSIAVTWGANSRDALKARSPDFLVDTPEALVQSID